MELKDFIGKVVINVESKKRYVLQKITSPCIEVTAAETDGRGYRASYSWPTINGDPISTGVLVFEDASLTELFKAAYAAYCHTRDAYYEEMGYWLRKS